MIRFALGNRLKYFATVVPLTGTIVILNSDPYLLRGAGFAAAVVLAYLFSFYVVPRWIK